MNQKDILQHYGILGMHWGVHKPDLQGREKDYRTKLAKTLENSKNIPKSDVKRFKYRNQSLPIRVGKNAASAAARAVAAAMIQAQLAGRDWKKPFQYSTPATMRKLVKDVLAATAKETIKNDLLARSASTRYTSEGVSKKPAAENARRSRATREDLIEFGASVVPAAAGLARWAALTKVQDIKAKRIANAAMIRSWSGRLLEDQVSYNLTQNAKGVWERPATSAIQKMGKVAN